MTLDPIHSTSSAPDLFPCLYCFSCYLCTVHSFKQAMSFSTLLICFAGLIQLSIAGYALEDDYTPSNFFSMFQFFTDSDPTNGFVQYVDETKAHSSGLVSTSYSSVYMGVDHTNVTPNGRPSVRLTSNKAYDHGLIILDIAHMPEGCGTWPAFWTVGPEWPKK